MLYNYTFSKLRVSWLMLAMLTLFSVRTFAADGDTFTYDEIEYVVISEKDKTCRTKNCNFEKSGDIVLPSSVPNTGKNYTLTGIGSDTFYNCRSLTSVTIPNFVTSIGKSAFYGCSSLASVTIPNSVTSIGKSAFYGCSSLASVTIPNSVTWIGESAFWDCGSLTSVTIPNSVSLIAKHTFYDCSSLASVTIPNSVTSIGESAFLGCGSLTSVTIPNSVTSIGESAFLGCGSLTSVTIPNSVTSIREMTFSGCSSLTSVTIPNSVTTLENEVFQYCSSLKTLIIPESVKSIGSRVFYNCTLNPLRFMGTVTLSEKSFENFNGLIECRAEQVEYIKQFTTSQVEAWDNKKYAIADVTPLILGFKLSLIYNADVGRTEGDKDLKITVFDSEGNEVKNIPVAVGQDIIISGLEPGTSYKLVLSWKDIAGLLYTNSEWILRTKYPSITLKKDNIKQTSFEVSSIEAVSDESFQVSEIGFEFRRKHIYNGNPIKITGLLPGNDYQLYPYVIYNDGLVYKGQTITASTKGWDFACSISNVGPTSAVFKASFTEDDAKADEVWWTFDKQNVNGKNLTLLSLTPETNNTLVFHIQYGDKYYAFSESFTTPALKFNTLKPQCVSSSCAIVAAETNISDIEPMVGFEWKKYDAPATLAPSEGYGAVCEGVLEGYIKNLQSTSYYNVRPFYKSATGKYYYGDWVTFDPSDFSYFEPTVRTYPVQEVTASSATVRGYALPGTDNIKRQGFQYWLSGNQNNIAAMAPAESEITTVEVAGQVMIATFSNLMDGTTYTYRAFVETDAGYAYGEEQTFTTESLSGVYDVEYVKPEVTVVGYYDMMGRRYDEPIRGINIVVYSDGSAKKVVYSNI